MDTYEKKYKDANNKVVARFGTNVAKEIFTDLYESEDERILEIIKHCIESRYLHTSTIKGISQKQCFAWLEKQGGQKSQRMVSAEAKEAMYNKPAWSIEDISKVQRICKYLDEAKKYYADINEVRECIDWLKSLEDRVLPQPKQKWKQENTDDLTDFENAMMHIGESFFGKNAGLDPNDTNAIKEQANTLLGLVPSKDWSEEDAVNFNLVYTYVPDDSLRDWLKSLKDKVQPQPKQEWSEEDEDYFDAIITKLEVTQEDAALTDNQLKFLKSLKYKVFPQNHWKPSDEQIEALDNFIFAKYPNIEKYEKSVKSLYNDLKKLKG